MSDDDQSLAGAVETSLADEPVDTTPPITPETFDSSAFLRGVRPTRRSVQIVERADLVGDLERLQGEFLEADAADDDAECDRIGAEFEQVAQAFHDSKRWYTVEKRSQEWIEKFREDVAKEHNLDLAVKDGKAKSPADRVEALLRQLVEQIVAPSGTTYEDLQALYQSNEGELNKLVIAMEMANSQQASAAKVVTPGFSLQRSGRNETPGSSKR